MPENGTELRSIVTGEFHNGSEDLYSILDGPSHHRGGNPRGFFGSSFVNAQPALHCSD
jgi:hypothetical protein